MDKDTFPLLVISADNVIFNTAYEPDYSFYLDTYDLSLRDSKENLIHSFKNSSLDDTLSSRLNSLQFKEKLFSKVERSMHRHMLFYPRGFLEQRLEAEANHKTQALTPKQLSKYKDAMTTI